MRFRHETMPQRIRFDSGAAADGVAAEVERLGAHRVMLIAGRSQAVTGDKIGAAVPLAVRHDEVVMHVPADVAERARAVAGRYDVDAIVSVGGGSATGLAKAVALTAGVPIVAVPTTYAGSEATDVWGITERGVKRTGADPGVLPRAVVYDAALIVGLPVDLSIASGLNALAHCVDSLWAPRADPISSALAVEGLRALDRGLPEVARDPASVGGRELTLYGAYLAAVAFAAAGSGLHHKICHVLGGMCALPHAQTHAAVLPHVLALNGSCAPEAERRLAEAFGAPTALAGLEALRARVGARHALRDYGLPEGDIRPVAEAVLPVVPPSNPAPVTSATLTALLRAAWEGSTP